MRTWFATLLIVFLVAADGLAGAANPFSLTVEVPSTITLGVQLYATVTITNVSNREADLMSSNPVCDYSIHLSRTDGIEVLKTAHGKLIVNCNADASRIFVRLKPGDKWARKLAVSDVFDLRDPGEYSIQIRRKPKPTAPELISNIGHFSVVAGGPR